MKGFLVVVTIVSLLVGVLLGIAFVLLLVILGKYIFASSLIDLNGTVGRIATVQIPFDYNSKGKIRVRVSKTTKELCALTYYPHRFWKGDKVLIVEVNDSYVWVYPWKEVS